MKNEIDSDFYCSADYFDLSHGGICKDPYGDESMKCLSLCKHRHRKWPTPEQYLKEYGEEYEGHRPVWWKYADNNGIWRTKSYNAVMGVIRSNLRNGRGYPEILIVCACTPWDRPPADWRPL